MEYEVCKRGVPVEDQSWTDIRAGRRMRPKITRSEDIQVLRGVAVSLVLLFHSGTIPAPAGYLGVDIFFVISGFLITLHILRDLDRQTFSLTQFYMKRARRLLPATYCTLSVTTAIYVLSYPDLLEHEVDPYPP
jgi:peptidoglycan/LPS O-acetylase OafA/YrhL